MKADGVADFDLYRFASLLQNTGKRSPPHQPG
jgi:hypothetical protein